MPPLAAPPPHECCRRPGTRASPRISPGRSSRLVPSCFARVVFSFFTMGDTTPAPHACLSRWG
eukprot:2383274-Prymnesium_polylepis.1